MSCESHSNRAIDAILAEWSVRFEASSGSLRIPGEGSRYGGSGCRERSGSMNRTIRAIGGAQDEHALAIPCALRARAPRDSGGCSGDPRARALRRGGLPDPAPIRATMASSARAMATRSSTGCWTRSGTWPRRSERSGSGTSGRARSDRPRHARPREHERPARRGLTIRCPAIAAPGALGYEARIRRWRVSRGGASEWRASGGGQGLDLLTGSRCESGASPSL